MDENKWLRRAVILLTLFIVGCTSGTGTTNNTDTSGGQNPLDSDITSTLPDQTPGDQTPGEQVAGNTPESNNIPTIEVSSEVGFLGNTFTLDASGSNDPDGDELDFTWELLTSPPGSSIFDIAADNTARYEFTPDMIGEYTIRVGVTDGNGGATSTEISVTVTHPVKALDYLPLDVEYSKQLDRMVLVSESPNQVHILNAETMESSSVLMNLVPTSVSVSPDGLKAAVGHDGWVSYIDLSNASLIDVIPVTTKAIDVVLAGNGYIYVFPETDQWESIYSLNIETKQQTTNSDYSIYAGTLAKLHPSGTSMYGADNGISPSDLAKYSIVDGTAEVLYDSPYHGDYPICGNLWFSEDGRRIFTACANIFLATESQTTDMNYAGSFAGIERVQHAAHSSAKNEIAVLPLGDWWDDGSDANQSIHLFDDEFIGFKQQVFIPKIIAGKNAFDASGEYLYYSADGSAKYAVIKADAASGLLNSYAIWTVIE